MKDKNNIKNRVAIFHYSGNFGASPSLINTSKLLSKNGYFVDIITLKIDESIPYKLNNPKICIYFSPWKKPKTSLKIIFNLIIYTFTAITVLKNKNYKCIIAVDPDGLISATVAGILKRTPTIYYSLELYISDEKKGIRRRIKKYLERFCHKFAKFTIIQDENRAKVLIEENKLHNPEIIIVPNSAMGRIKEIIKTDYLKKRFNIKSGSLTLLQAGGIADWNRSLELVQSARSWPKNWILVLHGKCEDNIYLNKIKNNISPGKVILSLSPVQYEQLDELIQSADIGLALYQIRGINFFHMASGKIFHYMKNGLPVITMNFPNLMEIVEKNRCGKCIKDENEIVKAAKSILGNYKSYSYNAWKSYNEKYEFEKSFNKVFSRLKEIQ